MVATIAGTSAGPSSDNHGIASQIHFAPPQAVSPARGRWSRSRDESYAGSWSPNSTRRSSSTSRGSRDRLWRPQPSLRGNSIEDKERHQQRQPPRQSPLHSLPRSLSHFLGYRRANEDKTAFVPLLNKLNDRILEGVISFIAVFGGMLLAASMTMAFSLEYTTVPLAIGALGATAVLIYAAPSTPFSQPRNVLGGHLISCVVGLVVSFASITRVLSRFEPVKLTLLEIQIAYVFNCSPRFVTQSEQPNATIHDFSRLVPVAEALSVAIAVALMQITGTVHPPGGATALLAATRPTGLFLPTIMCSVIVMQLWALAINNIGRGRWPAYWWSPGDNDERVDDQEDDAAGPGDDGGIAAAAAEKRSQAQGSSVIDEESTLTGSEWARGRRIVRAGSSAGSGPESHPQPGPHGFACNSASGPRVPSVSRTRTLGSVGEAIDEEPSV